MFGLLNISKPAGWTSRDIVNRVEKLARPHKVGHAGTLDPLATGVLVVCIGQATRLIEYVQQQSKRYRGTFLLGRESDTEDISGEVCELTNPPQPTQAELEAVLPRFIGRISQRPPAFSALRIHGQRAYTLARKGRTFELAEREIDIHEIQFVRYNYPELVLDIHCGSGTYVRSLGRDIAIALGTNAVMSELSRRAIGEFRLAEAVEFADLSCDKIAQSLLSPLLAVAHLPQMLVDDAEVLRLVQGKPLLRPDITTAGETVAIDSSGRFIALVHRVADGQLRSTRVFPPEL